MSLRRSFGIALTAILALSALGSSEIQRADATLTLPDDLDTPRIVETFKGLDVEDLDGHAWSDESLDGKVVLVDFWATWCVPCRAEFPHLAEAYERFGDDGFEILGVSVDQIAQERVVSFIEKERLTWPQVHEPTGLASPLAEGFGVTFLPRSYLFGRDGELLAVDLRGRALLDTLETIVPREPGSGGPASSEPASTR